MFDIGVQSIDFWDCGFKFRWGMEFCLLWVLCIVCFGADHWSRGVLPNVMCLSMIVKPRQWGGLGPLGAVVSWGHVLRVNSSLSHECVITEYKLYFNNLWPTIYLCIEVKEKKSALCHTVVLSLHLVWPFIMTFNCVCVCVCEHSISAILFMYWM